MAILTCWNRAIHSSAYSKQASSLIQWIGIASCDTSLRDCLEEWFASGGQLSACSIVLLDDCARSITRRFRLLDGEGQYYFGQFRLLARRILRGVDVEHAYRQAEQEMDAELDWEHGLFLNLGLLLEISTS